MIKIHHPWQLSYQEAVALQQDLAARVITHDIFDTINYIAGADVAYDKKSNQHIAAVVVLGAQTLHIVETASAVVPTHMPYIPGLLSFREIPAIIKALEKLTIKPDLIICDGNGIAHPRRLGIASHLGVICDIPTIGCAKSRLIGTCMMPDHIRGAQTSLIHNAEIIGSVVRTHPKFNPLYVSAGHRVSLETACAWVLKATTRYRVPETTRLADTLADTMKKQLEKTPY